VLADQAPLESVAPKSGTPKRVPDRDLTSNLGIAINPKFVEKGEVILLECALAIVLFLA
jgi:hypothetical protein